MNEINSIHLVSCVSTKNENPCPAGTLYRSPWFEKARAYVLTQGGPWYILSAEHGLVHPDTVIEPYDRTLNTMGVDDRRAWAERVKDQVRRQGLSPERFVVLAGQRYREFLLDFLNGRSESVVVPMEGLGIGQQLRWLNQSMSNG